MYSYRPINDCLYAVGGSDRRLARFENMFPLPTGVSYNAYVLLDERCAVIDAVDVAVAEQFYRNVEGLLAGRPLDYLICNHVEPDHCATVDGLLQRYPGAVLRVSAQGLKLLEQFYQHSYEGRVEIVEEGSILDLGQHRLETIAAPHVHWPEVTFTYETTSGWLFSADAFGSFRAPDGHVFADQVHFQRDWLDEARRYYVNIVGRQGPHVLRAMQKMADRPIRLILPVHGLIFRTAKEIDLILKKYHAWASYQAEEAGVVICYGSMYGNSALMADELAYELSRLEVENIRVYDVSETDPSFIISDLFRFTNGVFFCNNYNTELYPRMEALLREMMLLHYDRHQLSLVGNMSWGGRGPKIAHSILEDAKDLTYIGEELLFKSRMKEVERPRLQALAAAIKESLNA